MDEQMYRRNLIVSVCLHVGVVLLVGLSSLFARSTSEQIQLPGPVFEMIDIDLGVGVPPPAAAPPRRHQSRPRPRLPSRNPNRSRSLSR